MSEELDPYSKAPSAEHVTILNSAVTINYSDGDIATIHTRETEESHDGSVNFEEYAVADTIRLWAKKIATYIILDGKWYKPESRKLFYLTSFPSGYRLYTHKKGTKANPRTDSYLYGSTSPRCKVFRSPEEFALHAKWLVYGGPRDEAGESLCGCTYCSGRPQGQISKHLKKIAGDIFSTTYVSVPSSSSANPRKRKGNFNHARETTAPSRIIAKDYTGLSRGGGVRRWAEGDKDA